MISWIICHTWDEQHPGILCNSWDYLSFLGLSVTPGIICHSWVYLSLSEIICHSLPHKKNLGIASNFVQKWKQNLRLGQLNKELNCLQGVLQHWESLRWEMWQHWEVWEPGDVLPWEHPRQTGTGGIPQAGLSPARNKLSRTVSWERNSPQPPKPFLASLDEGSACSPLKCSRKAEFTTMSDLKMHYLLNNSIKVKKEDKGRSPGQHPDQI